MGEASPHADARATHRVKHVALVSLMSVLVLNIWTGGPLLGLWIGSRVQGTGPPSMGALAAVAGTIAVVSGGLMWALAHLSRLDDDLTGRRATVRRHLPWLRSLRGERPHEVGKTSALSPLEALLVASVFIVVALFEIWFFFFSGSPISQSAGTSG